MPLLKTMVIRSVNIISNSPDHCTQRSTINIITKTFINPKNILEYFINRGLFWIKVILGMKYVPFLTRHI